MQQDGPMVLHNILHTLKLITLARSIAVLYYAINRQQERQDVMMGFRFACLVLNEGCQREVVKQICEQLPDIGIAILP